jgi:hypothetical protein
MRREPKTRNAGLSPRALALSFRQGYDPELLIVECAFCGLPVLWERGCSTRILAGAGIDPLELDSHCLLLTEGCPRCSPEKGGQFSVRVFRVAPGPGRFFGLRPAGVA